MPTMDLSPKQGHRYIVHVVIASTVLYYVIDHSHLFMISGAHFPIVHCQAYVYSPATACHTVLSLARSSLENVHTCVQITSIILSQPALRI